MTIGLFVLLLIMLFGVSTLLTKTISFFVIKVTRNPFLAIQSLAILFLPGVIIHELAHWLVASILLVPTGTIEFLPQVEGDRVKLGSVQVAKTDIFRMFFIGIAPVIVGTGVLLLLFWFLSPTIIPFTFKTVIFFYIIFEIGNTMFSSKKDVEGVVGFTILLVFVVAFLFFLKVPLWQWFLHVNTLPVVKELFSQLSIFALLAIGIDILVILIFRGLLWILKK